MSIGKNIRFLRERAGLSQNDFAKMIGVSDKAVSTWENETRTPRMGAIQKIADCFNVQKTDIIGNEPIKSLPDNIIPIPKMKKVPLIGTIACGEPILATENIENIIDIPEDIRADFALRCKGDSMINARIFDGDIVYIRQQQTVENGEIAAVLIEDEATLKRMRLYDDHISLEPENPQYRPLVYWGEEMNGIRILGKAVAFTSAVR